MCVSLRQHLKIDVQHHVWSELQGVGANHEVNRLEMHAGVVVLHNFWFLHRVFDKVWHTIAN